jgi:hypothetical protein
MDAYSVAQILVGVYDLKVLQRGDVRVYVTMAIGIRLGRGRCLYQHHSAELHERRHTYNIQTAVKPEVDPQIHMRSVRYSHQASSQAKLRERPDSNLNRGHDHRRILVDEPDLDWIQRNRVLIIVSKGSYI